LNYLLDTCFLSELRKPKPHKAVLDWFEIIDEKRLFISALSIGELYYGIALLPDGKQKKEIKAWLQQIENSYADLIIPIDEKVAAQWGEMRALLQSRGITLNVVDGLLAATCSVYSLNLVTRNNKDFKDTGINILNPWQMNI